jgi:hypothetical protein
MGDDFRQTINDPALALHKLVLHKFVQVNYPDKIDKGVPKNFWTDNSFLPLYYKSRIVPPRYEKSIGWRRETADNGCVTKFLVW